MSSIHPTAILAAGAVVGQGTSIAAYSVIGPRVVIGSNCRIGSHVVLEGNTTIGSDNQIYQFASIGAAPQDLKYRGEDSKLEIGNHNIIREYVTLQPGTSGGGMVTRIGDNNLFMACSHVGHDSYIGNGNVVANSASIAGHVRIGDRVTIGGLVGIHQFVRIGDLALLAAGSMVAQDVPQFCLAQGDRAQLAGINVIGMERNGFSAEIVQRVRSLYRRLFLSTGLMKERLKLAEKDFGGYDECASFLEFVRSSERGVAAPRSKVSARDENAPSNGK